MNRTNDIMNLLDDFSSERDYSKELLRETDEILRSYVKKVNDRKMYEHSTRVADEIAAKKFNPDTIIAALLHDVPIDYIRKYNRKKTLDYKPVLEVLAAYHNIDTKLKNVAKKQELLTEQVIVDLASDIDLPAFSIIIAEQKDTLCDREVNQELALENAAFARDIIIPIAQKLGAFHDADILLQENLRINNPVAYNAIKNMTDSRKRERCDLYNRTLNRLIYIFDPNNKMIPEKLRRYQAYIKEFCYSERTEFSIYRYATKRINNWTSDFDELVRQNQIALYDYTLIIRDEVELDGEISEIDIFFAYYEEKLKSEKIYILGYGITKNRDSIYMLLCDEMDNPYRLFIKKESDYLKYVYGDTILESKKANLLSQRREQEINVFRKDGTVQSILAGATVLDFAFAIHSELGLNFEFAIINNTRQSLKTVLNKGDTVEIKAGKTAAADLTWFKYVKTDLARDILIKHFKLERTRLREGIVVEGEQPSKIRIITKDGFPVEMNSGATALDLAFKIHFEYGIHFDYAIINDSKVHSPAYTPLKDGDKVIIYKSETVKPNVQWFRYIETDQAKESLIKYFQHEFSGRE